MSKTCNECGTAIGEQYEFCFKCSQKLKSENKGSDNKEKDPWSNEGTTKELISAITKLNANMGALVQILKKNPKVLRQIADDMEKE